MNTIEKKEELLHEPTLVGEPAGKLSDEFMLKEMLKQINVTSITPETKLKFQEAIAMLASLKDEIIQKKQGALDKKDFIKNKISDLKTSGKVTIDDAEFQKSETSVLEFVRLLGTMIVEVERDVAYYQSLLSDNPPVQIHAFKFESDNYEEHINSKIQAIKKYVKTAKRDLSISFSRYCHGFDAQLRQISYVEQVIKYSNKK